MYEFLGEAGAAAEAAFARVLQRYRETSGHGPYVVEGSSAGALQCGHEVVRLEPLRSGTARPVCATGLIEESELVVV